MVLKIIKINNADCIFLIYFVFTRMFSLELETPETWIVQRINPLISGGNKKVTYT